jgi:hypothetical protein
MIESTESVVKCVVSNYIRDVENYIRVRSEEAGRPYGHVVHQVKGFKFTCADEKDKAMMLHNQTIREALGDVEDELRKLVHDWAQQYK